VTALLVALSTLTRLPLHPRGEIDARAVRDSVVFYPCVGLLLGALCALLAPFLRQADVPGLGGIVLVASLALISGGLHLDGLADWVDAVGGGRGDRTRMLEIMKDPRLGAHGATALVLLLLAKAAVLDAGLDGLQLVHWLCIPALARFALLPVIVWVAPARSEGLAHAVHGAGALRTLAPNALLLAAALGVTQQLELAIAIVAALAVAGALAIWALRRIGGVTGDVLGAIVELC
jgi:adenosylcobinamide-GDP ribazoletransferase